MTAGKIYYTVPATSTDNRRGVAPRYKQLMYSAARTPSPFIYITVLSSLFRRVAKLNSAIIRNRGQHILCKLRQYWRNSMMWIYIFFNVHHRLKHYFVKKMTSINYKSRTIFSKINKIKWIIKLFIIWWFSGGGFEYLFQDTRSIPTMVSMVKFVNMYIWCSFGSIFWTATYLGCLQTIYHRLDESD